MTPNTPPSSSRIPQHPLLSALRISPQLLSLLLLLSLSGPFLSSCGEEPVSPPPSPTKNNDDSSSSHKQRHTFAHLPFFLEDTCHSQDQRQRLASVRYQRWNGQTLQTLTEKSIKIYGTPLLSSSLTSGVFLPQSLDVNCRQKHHPLRRPCTYPEHWNPPPLKICRHHGHFDPQSLETIGITALVHLEKSHRHYLRHNPSSYRVPKARLYLLPQITYTTDSTQSHGMVHRNTVHDNLSYQAHFFNHPAFIIHPPSQGVARKAFSNHNTHPSHPPTVFFWQSDWALAHEFGHHILLSHVFRLSPSLSSLSALLSPFSSLIPFSWKSPLLHWRPSSSQDQLHHLASHHSHHKLRIWNTFNEAYADLWAFLATSKTSSTLNIFPCLAQSRDVAHPRFVDGIPKIITTKALQQFLQFQGAKAPHQDPVHCSVTDFKRYHTFAAAMAHGFYKIASASHSNLEQRLILTADALASMKWKNRFVSLSENLPHLTALALAHLLVEPTTRSQPLKPLAFSPSSAQCAAIKHYFPGLVAHRQWKTQSFIQCR